MKQRSTYVCCAMLAVLLLAMDCLLAQVPKKGLQPTARAESIYRGGLVNPPLPKPRFTLTDTSGAPYDLWSNTHGYVTLVFFGYTHCPDMCPLQMSTIGQALKKIPA